MKQNLREILVQVRGGHAAQLTLEAGERQYTRRFQPRERLILLGGGHIALHLCPLAARLGFSVTVVDDRESFVSPERFPEADEVLPGDYAQVIAQLHLGPGDYVAVMTRGHRWDGDCLRAVLAGEEFPRYLGMVASRSRGADLLRQLREEEFDPERLTRIHTPIGLAINALTLDEIAVSIAAELIQVRRSDTQRCSHSTTLTQSEPETALLEYAVEDPAPKALVVVLETKGSTPVKTGAMLVTDREAHAVGSIGGGWGEWECIRQAVELIGSGTQRVFSVSMDSRDAHGQDMSCGGEMLVLAADLQ